MSGLGVFCTGFLLQHTTLLGRATTLETDRARMTTDAISRNLVPLRAGTTTVAGRGGVVGTGRSGREVRNVFGDGVLGADVGDADV